jgi:glycine/D-amino acid oxidase-like deaminating enzyme
VPHRRCDLIYVGNGVCWGNRSTISLDTVTLVVPHYAILNVGDKPLVSLEAPPTYIAGRHARFVQQLLQKDGICNTAIADSANEIAVRSKAALKLLWSSCLWLLCHAQKPAPISVRQVHAECHDVLVELVQELWPMFLVVVGALQSPSPLADSLANTMGTRETETISLNDALLYLKQYSDSIPTAIPSLHLAMQELPDRNGVFAHASQTLHQQLILQVAGPQALSIFHDHPEKDQRTEDEMKVVDLTSSIGLSLIGRPSSLRQSGLSRPQTRSVLVVGAGIMGCSVALNLARMCAPNDDYRITVVDRGDNASDMRPTTCASWAWLNANQKQPAHYQQLNALGMHAWRCDPLLADLPLWNGSLVRFAAPLDQAAMASVSGFYTHSVGPLARHEWLGIEPNASFAGPNDDPVYFFPNEGHVDPCEAVLCMRREAMKQGVTFVWNQTVTDIQFNNSSTSSYATVTCQSASNDASKSTLPAAAPVSFNADVVVVAAGTGMAQAACGSIPLLHRPGRIAFFQPKRNDGSATPRLNRVVVDMVNNSHVLQRRDGVIVAGGGPLEVGGTGNATARRAAASSPTDRATLSTCEIQALKSGALQLAPRLLSDAAFVETAEAVRPMPQDGLPAIGYVCPGLYSIVSHSGITLGPLLGSLAAAEIVHDLQFELLIPYRPMRWNSNRQLGVCPT